LKLCPNNNKDENLEIYKKANDKNNAYAEKAWNIIKQMAFKDNSLKKNRIR
jgi:hypothetical protein